MKTLQEIKDDVAEKAGYKNWDFFLYTFSGANLAIVIKLNNEVAKRYAEEAIKVAAENATVEDPEFCEGYPMVDKSSILDLVNELK